MLKKSTYIVFIFLFILLITATGVHAQRQHDSSEEDENGRLSDELEEDLNGIDEENYSSSYETTSSVSYDRQGAYDYAKYYWNRVCSDGVFWDGGSYPSGITVLPPGQLLNSRKYSGFDCAHFVSCAIGSEPNQIGGGLNIPSHWPNCPYGTYGIGSAEALKNHLLDNGIAEAVNSHTQLSKGDVIWYFFPSINRNHVVVYMGDGKISSHSSSYDEEPWDIYMTNHPNLDYEFLRIKTDGEPSSLSFTGLTPSTVNTDTAPYDAELTATGTNFNNVDRISFSWSGASSGGSATWNRDDSNWDQKVNVISDTEMKLKPRVVGSTATWSGTDVWTVTLRDTSNATASRTFTVNFNTTSCSVSTPERPDGPTSGETGVSYEFETGGSSCLAGHDVQYQFSMRQDGGTWHDGEWRDTGWMVGEFSKEGTYDIRARARCANNTSVTSSWSPSLTVVIGDEPDCSVNTPSRPTGPSSGEPGVNYTYSTGGSSCAAGHSVEYRFWWKKVGGSYTSTNWSTSSNTSLSFAEEGTYRLDAQARCANSGVTSGYSEALTVEIIADSEYYNLTVNSSNPSSGVSISSNSGHSGTTSYTKTVEQGTSVNLTAPQYVGEGESRKSFSNWSGNVYSSDRTINFTIVENKTVTANYDDDPETSFSDVPTGHPFFTEIEALVAAGIAEGYNDNTFRPSSIVTRMAMAAFLVRGLELDQDYTVPAQPTFPDVPIDHPFFDEIELLAASGITEGYDDGTFRPSSNVTRMAMAVFLKRGLDLDEEYDVPDELSFTDVLSDHPFYEEIELLAASGISTGWEEDDGYEFRPGQDVTRMAMAAFLVRGLGLED